MDKLYENYEIKLKQIYRTLFFMYGTNISRGSYKRMNNRYIDWEKVTELLTNLIEIAETAQKENVDLGLIPIFHYTIDATYSLVSSLASSSRKKKLLATFNHLSDLYMSFTPKEVKKEKANPSDIDELIRSAKIFKLSAIVGMHYYAIYNGIYTFDKYSTAEELLFDLKAASSTQLIKVSDCIRYLMNRVWDMPNVWHTKGGKKLADALLALWKDMVWPKYCPHRYADQIPIEWEILEMAENLAGEIDEPKQQSSIDEVIKSMHLFSFKSFEMFYRTGQIAKEYYTSEEELLRVINSTDKSPILKVFNHILYNKISERPELKETDILEKLKHYCDANKVTDDKLKKAQALLTVLEVLDDLKLLAAESKTLPKRKDFETLLKFKDIVNRLIVIIKMFDFRDKSLSKNCYFNLITFYITEYSNYLNSKDKSYSTQNFENMQLPFLRYLLAFLREDSSDDFEANYKTSGQLIYGISRLSKKSDPVLRNYMALVCQQILDLTGGVGLPDEELPGSTLRLVVAANLLDESNNLSHAFRLLQVERGVEKRLEKRTLQ